MNNHLTIKTFGQAALLLDGQPVEKFRSRKAIALILYLACTQKEENREMLADLFWDASSTKQALSNLRTVLAMIRSPLGEFIRIQNGTVNFAPQTNLTVDYIQLREELTSIPATLDSTATDKLQRALRLYEGEFLQSFEVQNAPRFDDWVFTKRYCIRNHVSTAYQKLAAFYLDCGDYMAGIDIANRWLQLDRVNESAHAYLIELFSKSGQRSAALAQYEVCKKVLWKELEVEPGDQIQTLQLGLQA